MTFNNVVKRYLGWCPRFESRIPLPMQFNQQAPGLKLTMFVVAFSWSLVRLLGGLSMVSGLLTILVTPETYALMILGGLSRVSWTSQREPSY